MENYCVKKYSVEQLDKGQDLLMNLISREKQAKISLNRYNERIDECEKMLKLNEEMRENENLSESVYLVNKRIHEDNVYEYKKCASRMEIHIEDIEKEIEELREKYCL
jgi:hypothetical protein